MKIRNIFFALGFAFLFANCSDDFWRTNRRAVCQTVS